MHSSRRKSGHASANTSMTDVRKAARSSRAAPSSSNNNKLGKSPKDRDREWEDDGYWDDERDSFPQYCMSCEKQFFPQDERILFCSEACRRSDQNSNASYSGRSHYASHPPNHNNYPYHAVDHPSPRDIIPRASPSRPSSTYFSPPEDTDVLSHPSSAMSALRSLNTTHPPSPPSPTNGQSIWPFSRSTTTSPSSSYTRSHSGFFSSTYDTVYQYGTDRPLPSRRPGAGYSRPKTIELVTPMIGR